MLARLEALGLIICSTASLWLAALLISIPLAAITQPTTTTAASPASYLLARASVYHQPGAVAITTTTNQPTETSTSPTTTASNTTNQPGAVAIARRAVLQVGQYTLFVRCLIQYGILSLLAGDLATFTAYWSGN